MPIKIFADEKPIYIIDKLTASLKTLAARKDVIAYTVKNIPGAEVLIADLAADNISAAVLSGKNAAEIKTRLFSECRVIEAAGGIVQNEDKDILFIFRRGKWDLPKGKIDKGETLEACAAREIEEETGVKDLTLKRKIGETYHIYREKGKQVLKVSHWFYFTCESEQKLLPQTDEDITEVKWIPTKKIKEPMANTYENIKEIMREFFDTP